MNTTESNIEIIDCICCWYDILNFGGPLKEAFWDLNNTNCLSQLNRLKLLDLTHVNRFSALHHTTSFTLNDGVVINFDIEPQKVNFKRTLVFVFDDLLNEFEILNYRDLQNNFSGLRGVISFGQRYDYIIPPLTKSMYDGFISSFHPRALQMNTAFSKSYIMENSGSKSGITGNQLYIDVYVLERLESILLEKNTTFFRIEKNLDNPNLEYFFSIMEVKTNILTVYFKQEFVSYNQNGIDTKLFVLKNRDSIQDVFANEQAYLDAKRYLQYEQLAAQEDAQKGDS